MVERSVTWANPTALHARPAALFVQAVNQFPGTEVYIRKGEREVSGRSLLSILSLGIGPGEAVTLRCDGPKEEELLRTLVALAENGLAS